MGNRDDWRIGTSRGYFVYLWNRGSSNILLASGGRFSLYWLFSKVLKVQLIRSEFNLWSLSRDLSLACLILLLVIIRWLSFRFWLRLLLLLLLGFWFLFLLLSNLLVGNMNHSLKGFLDTGCSLNLVLELLCQLFRSHLLLSQLKTGLGSDLGLSFELISGLLAEGLTLCQSRNCFDFGSMLLLKFLKSFFLRHLFIESLCS